MTTLDRLALMSLLRELNPKDGDQITILSTRSGKGYKLYCHDGMVETWRFSLVLEWLMANP
jgi:hypothetical protein